MLFYKGVSSQKAVSYKTNNLALFFFFFLADYLKIASLNYYTVLGSLGPGCLWVCVCVCLWVWVEVPVHICLTHLNSHFM